MVYQHIPLNGMESILLCVVDSSIGSWSLLQTNKQRKIVKHSIVDSPLNSFTLEKICSFRSRKMIKELKKEQVFFFPSSLLTGHFCEEKLHSVQVHIMFLLPWCLIFLLLLVLIFPIIWHWYWISFVVTTLAQILLSFKFYHHSSRNR